MPHRLHHHLIGHHVHYTEMNEAYIAMGASAFGMSLVNIFIPIYLYNLGYGLGLIALFFIIVNMLRGAVTPFAAKLLARFGPKHMLAFSQLLGIAYVLLFTQAPEGAAVVLAVSVLLGINAGFFWLSYHVNFSAVRSNSRGSSQVSIVFILSAAAHALGPLVGGIIATQFGIFYAFIAAAAFLFVAGYVMLQTPEQTPPEGFRMRDLGRNWRPMRRILFANFANTSQNEIAMHTWPLFIFLFLGTYQLVGFVASLALVASVIIMFIVGKRGDRGKNQQQLGAGSKSTAFVHILRPLAQTFGAAAGVNILYEVFGNFYKVPYASYYYDHANQAPSRIGFIARMEIVAGAGFASSWVFILLLALLLPLKAALIVSFFYAALAALFVTKIVPRAEHMPAPVVAEKQEA